MKTKLSVIIPVYNVERFLGQCLKSILEQVSNSDAIEVIIVNDGSPDSSAEIIEKYRDLYPQYVKVINQENQGLSMARNNGLSLARGEYVWFVDSDDWIPEGAISRIMLEITNYNNVDVYSSFLISYYEEDDCFRRKEYKGALSFSGTEYLKKNLPIGASPRFICKRLFLNENNLWFIPNILHEDAMWGYMMLYKAKRIKIIQEPIYVYRIRKSGSIMSSISIRSAKDLLKGHKLLYSWMDNNVDSNDKKMYEVAIFGVIKSLLDFNKNLVGSSEYENFMQSNRKYIKKNALRVFMYQKTNISAIIIALSPRLFSKLCSVKIKLLKK